MEQVTFKEVVAIVTGLMVLVGIGVNVGYFKGVLAELKRRVDSLESTTRSGEDVEKKKIDAANERHLQYERRLVKLESAYGSLTETMKLGFEQLNRRLDQLQNRLDTK